MNFSYFRCSVPSSVSPQSVIGLKSVELSMMSASPPSHISELQCDVNSDVMLSAGW